MARFNRLLRAASLAAILAIPATGQEQRSFTLNTATIAPVKLSAPSIDNAVLGAHREPSPTFDGSFAAERTPSTNDASTPDESYHWRILQSWGPGNDCWVWSAQGELDQEPIGGVRFFDLNGRYRDPSSLEEGAFIGAVDPQHSRQGPRPRNRFGKPHHLIGTGFRFMSDVRCFTHVGTYDFAATFCVTDDECRENPKVFPTHLELRPFIYGVFQCLQPETDEVWIHNATLYFNQRPTSDSIRPVLGDEPIADVQVTTRWPWVTVSFALSRAEYTARFPMGALTTIELRSDNQHTPKATYFFSPADEWMPRCAPLR